MTVRLKSLSARGEGRIAVLFEIGDGEHVQRETFLLSAARVADLSLQVGECTAECYEAVEHSAALERGKEHKKSTPFFYVLRVSFIFY